MSTRRHTLTALCLCSLAASFPAMSARVAGQSSLPGSELRVWVITAAPGDAVWQRYGHNAIRVVDTSTGRDVSYNWGLFDFAQVDFIPRFLRGEMLYSMAGLDTRAMVQSYVREQRTVTMQELALTPAQKRELHDLAEENALPQNRDYIYDYYRNNCSTRVRDLLDRVLGGAIRERFADRTSSSTYRSLTRMANRSDPPLSAGIDLLLGIDTDRPLTVWEEMFLPDELKEALREVTVDDGEGGARPLVVSEEVVFQAPPSAAAAGPPASRVWVFLVIGSLLGLLFAGVGRTVPRGAWARQLTAVAVIAWCVLGTVLGVILTSLLFTDHEFAWHNYNLFFFNPLLAVLAVLVVAAELRGTMRSAAARFALLVLALAIIGALLDAVAAPRQSNADFMVLAIPALAGIAYMLSVRPSVAVRSTSADAPGT